MHALDDCLNKTLEDIKQLFVSEKFFVSSDTNYYSISRDGVNYFLDQNNYNRDRYEDDVFKNTDTFSI